MTVTELLPAIRALPKAERLQLVQLLIDDAAETPTATDTIPERLRQYLPPDSAGIEIGSHTTTDAAGWIMIASMFPLDAKLDVHTPLDCYQAAAALQQLLDAEKIQPAATTTP